MNRQQNVGSIIFTHKFKILKKKYFLFATGFYSSKEFPFIVHICLLMQKQKLFIETSNNFIYVLTTYIGSTCNKEKLKIHEINFCSYTLKKLKYINKCRGTTTEIWITRYNFCNCTEHNVLAALFTHAWLLINCLTVFHMKLDCTV